MGRIEVCGIRLYAHHGCMPEETKLGGNYEVDVILEADLSKSEKSDKLEDTLDYVAVYNIVVREMQTPSSLIEHVAARIGASLKKQWPEIISGEVSIKKLNTPIGGVISFVKITHNI
jgi:7,8-dihydroneopterin aldolase/epimerase/oxygenase